MPLSTLFTDEEVEYSREIIRVANTTSNQAELVNKLDSLNAAQVIACQRDIEKWKSIEYGTEKSKGGIKGTDYSTERNRFHIRNKYRERLGYDPLPEPLEIGEMGLFSMGISSFGSGSTEDEYSSSGGSADW